LLYTGGGAARVHLEQLLTLNIHPPERATRKEGGGRKEGGRGRKEGGGSVETLAHS